MRKLLMPALLACLVFFSCNTERRIARACAKCTSKDTVQIAVFKKEEVRVLDSTTAKVDTIKVQLPADSSVYRAYIKCISEKGEPARPVIISSGQHTGSRMNTSVFLDSLGGLTIRTNLLADSIVLLNVTISKLRKEVSNKTTDSSSSLVKHYVSPCPEQKHKGFISFLAWSGGILWILLILWAILKVVKLSIPGAAEMGILGRLLRWIT